MPVVADLEKQRLVAHGGEHRGPQRHGRDATPDGGLYWLLIAVTLFVGIIAGDAAVGMHMFSSVCESTRSMAARAGARDW
ncbi:MAG: hypothetical protein M3186_13835 [Actinomycetota bacterium]|nr:hypothetical protein [Actinomycetota bacterium]